MSEELPVNGGGEGVATGEEAERQEQQDETKPKPKSGLVARQRKAPNVPRSRNVPKKAARPDERLVRQACADQVARGYHLPAHSTHLHWMHGPWPSLGMPLGMHHFSQVHYPTGTPLRASAGSNGQAQALLHRSYSALPSLFALSKGFMFACALVWLCPCQVCNEAC